MRGIEILEILKQAKGLIESDFRFADCRISFMPDEDIMSGRFVDDIYQQEIKVGIKDFVENLSCEFKSNAMTTSLVSLFHEACGHGLQYFDEFEKDCSLSKLLAASYYSCKESHYYYGYDTVVVDRDGNSYGKDLSKRYLNHPHEIAAQYAGIYGVNCFLSKRFGKEISDRLICDYVNERIALGWEFIESKTPFESIEDVFAAFEIKFQKCAMRCREYDLGKDRGGILVRYAGEYNCSSLLNRMEVCHDGFRQDLAMAAAYK